MTKNAANDNKAMIMKAELKHTFLVFEAQVAQYAFYFIGTL